MAKLNIFNPFVGDWTGKIFSELIAKLAIMGHTVRDCTKKEQLHIYPYLDEDGKESSINNKKVLIIEDDETKKFRAIDTGDYAGISKFRSREIAKLPKCDFILRCQYRDGFYDEIFGAGKIRPFLYWEKHIDLMARNIEEYRGIKRSIPKMYFRGSRSKSRCGILPYLLPYRNNEGGIIIADSYYRESCSYKLNLSLPGEGAFCHREIESFACGTPVISPTLKNSYAFPLIPNVHYIDAGPIVRRMPYIDIAKNIERRFIEVIDDERFLNQVAENAKIWYDTYVRLPNGINHSIRLLELDKPNLSF